MAGNITPIFARVGNIGLAQANVAVTGADMTSASLIFTGNSVNGSIVNEVRVKYLPGTSTVATVFRVFVNNGNNTLSNTQNNSLLSEITIPAITTTQTAATPDYVIPMPRGGLVLPPGYRLYGTIGTYSTGTFMISAYGGDY
jgi:hypothetical protein